MTLQNEEAKNSERKAFNGIRAQSYLRTTTSSYHTFTSAEGEDQFYWYLTGSVGLLLAVTAETFSMLSMHTHQAGI